MNHTDSLHRSRAARYPFHALGWLAAAAALSCSESPTSPHQPAAQTPFVASVSRLNTAHLVYFSLPEGSVPNGGSAHLRVARTGAVAQLEVVDGGFDPIALTAIVGDTIEVTITMMNGSEPVSYKVGVGKPVPPVIVRTQPPKQKRDVPLNSAVKVVFSEPIDPATVTGSNIALRKNGQPVAGRLQFADAAHTSVEFVPGAGLEPETDYELMVTKGVKDLDGATLEAALTVPFTTTVGALVFSLQPILSVAEHPVSHAPAVRLVTQVIARSSSGSISTGFTGNVTLTLADGTAGGRLFGTTTVQAVEGIATFLDVWLNAIGTGHVVIATASPYGSTSSSPFDAGGKLVFTVAPTSALAGVSMVPVQIEARDMAGGLVSTFGRPVTLSVAPGVTGVTLHGTTAVAAGFGTAVFSDLRIDEVSESVQFRIQSDGIPDAVSGAFAVNRMRLAFDPIPTRLPLGVTMEPLLVRAYDANGNSATRFDGEVTLSVSPGGASLGGTRTVRAIAGVARYTDLRFDAAGSAFTLVATAACCQTSVQSAPLEVVTAKLVFTSQPTAANAIATITPVTVQVQRFDGSPVPYDGPVTIEIANNPAAGVLRGTTTVTAVNGTATFSDLSIDAPGVGYTLRTTASGAVDGISLPFNILSEWVARAPMPTPRTGLGVDVINGLLYAVGGDAQAGYFDPVSRVDVYDPATDRWSTRASMPTARSYLGVTAVNGILYAIGGRTNGGTATGTVEAYDPATDKWTTRAPMPTPRYGLSIEAVNGIIYAVGESFGYNGAGSVVEAYDPVANTWTTKARLPAPLAFPGLVAVNGLLYAIGGENDDVYADVSVYDPATDSWSYRSAMADARSGFGAVAVNNVIYAISGWYTSRVEGYDVTTDHWTPKAPIPSPRYLFAAAAINGEIHIVGGRPGNSFGPANGEHFAYRP